MDFIQQANYILYGGSFDPPHKGHQALILKILSLFRPNILYLVPTSQNPLKKKSPQHALYRLQLLSRCVCDILGKKVGNNIVNYHKKKHGNIKICDWEIYKKKPSYTIDLLKKFQRKKPFLAMGSDGFMSLHQWKNPKKLLLQTNCIIFYNKKGKKILKPVPSNLIQKQLKKIYGKELVEIKIFKKKHILVEIHLIKNIRSFFLFVALKTDEISSTKIRNSLAQGKKPLYLSKSVLSFIKEKKLYIRKDR